MFETTFEEFEGLLIYCCRNIHTGEYFKVIPELGGMLQELALSNKSKLYNIIDNYSDTDDFFANQRYKSSLLIPFPNRVNNGSYQYHGNNYQLEISDLENNHALHGFIHNRPFIIENEDITSDSISVTLYYRYKGEIKGYPFPFDVRIRYSLNTEGFEFFGEIVNKGNHDIPMGMGWHPYFKIGKTVDSLMLELPDSQQIYTDNRKIPTGELSDDIIFSKPSRIGSAEIDNGYKVEEQNKAKICLSSSEVSIVVWQETGLGKFNYLQIYIPPDRNSIAIEPSTCSPDAFNNGNGLVILEPSAVLSAQSGVYLTDSQLK